METLEDIEALIEVRIGGVNHGVRDDAARGETAVRQHFRERHLTGIGLDDTAVQQTDIVFGPEHNVARA